MHIPYQFAVPGGLFVLTLVFGFWLSRLGKPYNGVLFNIHKLIALGAVVVTAIQMVKLLRGMETQALVIVLVVVAALCVIALFASGALMSAGKLGYALMLTIHRVAPLVLVLCCALALYGLGKSYEVPFEPEISPERAAEYMAFNRGEKGNPFRDSFFTYDGLQDCQRAGHPITDYDHHHPAGAEGQSLAGHGARSRA